MDEEKKGRDLITTILVTIIIIAATVFVTYHVTFNNTVTRYLSKTNTEYMKAKMSLIKAELEENSIYDLDEEKMTEYAIKGYTLGVGDQYTQYLTEDEMVALSESTTGNYVGIGVQMVKSAELNAVVIYDTFEDYPAEKAGIQAGDVIVSVDDTDCIGKTLSEVSRLLSGEAGSHTKVTVRRDETEMEFEIERVQIKEKTVYSEILDKNVAYIRISSFDIGTAEDFKNAYNNIKQQNPKGLIIDLRNNGGGVVDEALLIANTMVEKGNTLLISVDKTKKEVYHKAGEEPIVDVPVVVLINKRTASASEILTASLRANRGFKIIGENSYGKGVIQAIKQFNDGTGLKITIQEYFSPNHDVINGVGIKPDIEVDLDDEWKSYLNVPHEHDKQLQRALEEF